MRTCLLVLLGLTLCYAKKSYDGVKIIRANPETEAHLQWLRNFQKYNGNECEFWKDVTKVASPVDIQVSPRVAALFPAYAESVNLSYKVLIENLQKELDRQEFLRKRRRNPRSSDDFALDEYHTLSEIHAFLDDFAESYKDVEHSIIGTSMQGKPITKFYIGSGKNPIIAFDCGIHAREWISPATCLYVINQLLTSPEGEELRNNYDWFFIPVTNADGYHHTWAEDRMWRKNLEHKDPVSGCLGTDLNRNYDANFGGGGSSDNVCDETYHGPSAFSDPETAAHRDALLPLAGKILAHFSVHSYGQKWMGPFGYKPEYPDEFDEIMRVAQVGMDALSSLYGTQYVKGSSYHTIYQTSGGGRDWAYDQLKAVYSYVIELRDKGEYGFLLPEDQILPTAKETWAGFAAAVKAMKRDYVKL